MTPEGARRLVAAAHHELVTPADSFINKRRVDIVGYRPYLIEYDTRFSTIDLRDGASTTPEDTWRNYQR